MNEDKIKNCSGINIWGPKMTISASLSHFLIIFNCSSNFAIYGAKVPKLTRITLILTQITVIHNNQHIHLHHHRHNHHHHYHLRRKAFAKGYLNPKTTRITTSNLPSSPSSPLSPLLPLSPSSPGPEVPRVFREHNQFWPDLLLSELPSPNIFAGW